jgi:hypothetical protein
LYAQHRRLDLVRRQHQRRHVEALVEHIADAGLAADGNTLRKKRRDVAIDGPFGGLAFGRHHVCRHQLLRALQDLDGLETTVCFAHVFVPPVLTRCCQQTGGEIVSSGLDRHRT